jgi:hypothetical protein
MIAANLMYFAQLRASWKRFLGITIGVALTSAVVVSGSKWDTFSAQIVNNLITSFCVGSLFWLAAPVVMSYTDRIRLSRGGLFALPRQRPS